MPAKRTAHASSAIDGLHRTVALPTMPLNIRTVHTADLTNLRPNPPWGSRRPSTAIKSVVRLRPCGGSTARANWSRMSLL